MKKTNKKLLLALGTLTTVAAPVAAVVSCGSDSGSVRHFNLLPTYTGQADQLIALGIQADYYPLQLNTKLPFDYLANPDKYMPEQTNEFKNKFKASVDYIMPKTQGVSWWNQDAKNSDDSRISNTYWQDQEGSVLLYEHYLLDDDQKVVEESWAPKHTNKVTAETNFRASRDPYTRLPKGVFFGWDLSNKTLTEIVTADRKGTISDVTSQPTDAATEKNYDPQASDGKAMAGAATTTKGTVNVTLQTGDGSGTLSDEVCEIDKKAASVILAMRQKRSEFLKDGSGESSWFYNDWFFADSFHRMFLDNKEFQTSPFAEWMVDSTKESPFTTAADTTANADEDIKALFDASTYTSDEVANKVEPKSTAGTPASAHHPIYEQQEGTLGAAPMFEGAQRDNQLYLFNVAWQVQNLAKTGSPYGQAYVDTLPEKSPAGSTAITADSKESAKGVVQYIKSHVTSAQYDEMSTALVNASSITKQLKTRMGNMKTYFNDLGLNGKKFGMMTLAPGHGVSTIQSMSKYSFIYKELGFAQPLPSNLDHLAAGANTYLADWSTDGKGTNTNLGGEDSDTIQGKASYGTHAEVESETVANAIGTDSLFNMDDNGWFWTLGEAGELNQDKINLFKGQFDLGVLAARDENFDTEIKGNTNVDTAIQGLFSSGSKQKLDTSWDGTADNLKTGGIRVNYDLWNEGIKTPFVMHMVLDQIMAVAENASGKTQAQIDALKDHRDAALNWGDYFTNTFTQNVKHDIEG